MKIGAGVAAGLLVAAISFSAPSAAFAFELGPFHIGLPFLGRHVAHRRRPAPSPDVPADARLCDYAGRERPAAKRHARCRRSRRGAALSGLALPIIYDIVFWPSSSLQWPFSYDAIFMPRSTRRLGIRAAARVKPIADPRSSNGSAERSGPVPSSGRCCRNWAARSPWPRASSRSSVPSRRPRSRGASRDHGNTARSADHGARHCSRAAAGVRQSLNPNQRTRFAALHSAQSADHKNAAEDFPPACGPRRRRSIGRSMRSINR